MLSHDVAHLFVNCEKGKEFWRNFKTWVMGKIHISDRNIFSFLKMFIIKLSNYLSKILYKNKFYTKSINMIGFESYVKRKVVNEMCIAKLNDTYNKFLGKWSSLCHYFISES